MRAGERESARGTAKQLLATLGRRQGDEIQQTAVDFRVFAPNRRIESVRQAGLELRRCQADDPRLICVVDAVRGFARRDIPIRVVGPFGILPGEPADPAALPARYRSLRVGRNDRGEIVADQSADICAVASGDRTRRITILDMAMRIADETTQLRIICARYIDIGIGLRNQPAASPCQYPRIGPETP